MAFPSGLKVLGPALTSVAEGLQAVPQYIDKDEELQERHEDRLARRELRPLSLEEAKLRLEESRRKLTQPKIQSLGQGNYAITNPDGTVEVRSLGGHQGTIKPLGSTHFLTTDAEGNQKIQELPSADPMKQMQAQGWNMIRQWYPQGLTAEALKDPRVQQVVDTLIKQRSDIVVVPQVGAYNRGDLQNAAPGAPGAPGTPGTQPPSSPPATSTGSGLESRLVRAILGTERSGEQSTSPKGAVSKYQLMPETARKYLPAWMQQLSAPQIQEALLKYPGLAQQVGQAHLQELQGKYPGRPDLVAAAYFSGEGNVDDVTGTVKNPLLRAVGSDGKPFGPTVQQYVDRFLQHYNGQTPPPGQAQRPPSSSTPPTPQAQTAEQRRQRYEGMLPGAAFDELKSQWPSMPEAGRATALQVFRQVYGADPTEAARSRWKTPTGAIQKQPGLPPGAPQPLVQNPQLARQSEQDYLHNVRDVERLNLEIDRVNLAEKHAATEKEREQLRGRRAELHEQRQLALHVQTQTKGMQEQLQSIERSDSLTNEILPLITPYTVGAVGRSRAALQSFFGQFPVIGAAQMKSLNDLVAQGAFEARQGALAPTPEENAIFANLLTRYDPRMQQIEFLSTALAYAHARALKPSGQIRITDLRNAEQQIKRAQTPADFVTVLLQNKKFLAGERGRAQKMIDDVTRRLSAGTTAPSSPASGDAPGTLTLPPGTRLETDEADPLDQELKD